jgi:hypothetical protein
MWPKKMHVSSVASVLIRMSWSLQKHIKDKGFGISCVRRESAAALRLNASRVNFVRARREDSVAGRRQHYS